MRKTIRRARSMTSHDWGLEMRIGKAAAPGTPVGRLGGRAMSMKKKPVPYRLFTRSEKAKYGYPDDWVVMRIGTPAPPGTPVGTTGISTLEQMRQAKDVPMLRPGELFERFQREQQASLRRARAKERKRKLSRSRKVARRKPSKRRRG